MANLPESAIWEDGIYTITVTDNVHGGLPDIAQRIGVANAAVMQLGNRTAWLKAQIDALWTPTVSVLTSNAAMDAIDMTSVWSVAQGVLYPPLVIGGLIEHAELDDGSAFQRAYRITPAGTFLTKHIRVRRGGLWSVWTAVGSDIGDLVIQTHATAPTNRLEAIGALLNRVTYADLFDRIGTLYGAGDGTTTFGTLDARGEFLRGWDNGRGVDLARALGTAQGDMFAAHNHEAHHWLPDMIDTTGGRNIPGADTGASGSYAGTRSDTLENTGGIETRPRNVSVNICIQF